MKKIEIELCFILLLILNNFVEIPELIILAKELGIREVHIGNYYIGIGEHIQYSLLNIKEEYNNVIDKAGTIAVESGIKFVARKFFSEKEMDGKFFCQEPYNLCFISVKGDVSPCCYSGNYTIGNVYKNNFEAIWFGKEYIKLRKKRYLSVCKGCSPYSVFDNVFVHFTSFFKESKDYKKFEEEIMNL